jgi:hypothetical protein
MEENWMKDFFRRIRNIGIGIFISTILFTGFRSCNREAGLYEYANENLPKIMKKQEDDFHIKYPEKPNIFVNTRRVGSFLQDPREYAGRYDSSFQMIILDSFENTYPEKSRLGGILGRSNQGRMDTLETLRHELGHYYTDKRSRSRGKGVYPPLGKYYDLSRNYEALQYRYFVRKDENSRKELDDFKTKNLGALTEIFYYQLISEGIAEYFEFSGGKKPDFKDCKYPRTYMDIKDGEETKIIYDGGYNLVSPILSLNCSDGIDYLIGNLPTSERIDELPQYRERALRELRGHEQRKLKSISGGKN